MKNILAENMRRFGTKNLTEQTETQDAYAQIYNELETVGNPKQEKIEYVSHGKYSKRHRLTWTGTGWTAKLDPHFINKAGAVDGAEFTIDFESPSLQREYQGPLRSNFKTLGKGDGQYATTYLITPDDAGNFELIYRNLPGSTHRIGPDDGTFH